MGCSTSEAEDASGAVIEVTKDPELDENVLLQPAFINHAQDSVIDVGKDGGSPDLDVLQVLERQQDNGHESTVWCVDFDASGSRMVS